MSPGASTGAFEPVADVYAGDEDLLRGVPTAAERVDVLFRIEADPDPDALFRIAGIVSLANCAPHGGRIGATASGKLEIALELRAVPVTTRELIRRKLSQLTCVTHADAYALPNRAEPPASADG
jgi:hypothetical protein